MINKKRQITKKREDKITLKLKTTNAYELDRTELYKYVTNRNEGLVYSDKHIKIFNTRSAIKIISTKHPNLEIQIYVGEFHVYDKEKGNSIDIFGDTTISPKCTLKGLLKRLDRLVVKLVSDKHFEETQNGIIYGSHRLYKYIDLKISMMKYKESIASFKSDLVSLDVEIENAREYNKLSTHKNLKYGDYNGLRIESFSRPIRTLINKQKLYLSSIKANEKQIAIIQDEINKLKVNNYYASGNH